jgi:hypothetical protein
MFSMKSKKPEKVESTAFSDFVRNASSKTKKKTFEKVLRQAALEQKRILDMANTTA